MFKKLDWYVIKTYLGPFLFIFSILLFIFVVQMVWIQLDKFTGKGLDMWDITKLLFYLGVTVIQMVLPLTILLSAIMTFGGFGERYEMAAFKASGISLVRIMMPLFVFTCLMSVGLFFFSNRVVPDNQKRAKNMIFNIARTRPALNFVSGRFINEIPSFSIKVANKYGDNGEKLDKVFLHKTTNYNENQQTIIADKGVLVPTKDKNFLKFDLYHGYIYQNDIQGKSPQERTKQEYSTTKFDTLTMLIDISLLINKAIEKENITDYYKFNDYFEINNDLTKFDSVSIPIVDNYYNNIIFSTTDNVKGLEELDAESLDPKPEAPINFNEEDENTKKIAIDNALFALKSTQDQVNGNVEQVKDRVRNKARIIIHQQKIISFSVTCILFFLIGAPLGAIIRKGGIGMPVVVAIIIFVIFLILLTTFENLAKNNYLNPYLATWLPNMIMLPLGIFFTYKSMSDSDIFDINNYLKPFQKIFPRNSNQKEHQRYQ